MIAATASAGSSVDHGRDGRDWELMSSDRQKTFHYTGAASQTPGWEEEQPMLRSMLPSSAMHAPHTPHRYFYRQYEHHLTEPYRRMSPGDHYDEI